MAVRLPRLGQPSSDGRSAGVALGTRESDSARLRAFSRDFNAATADRSAAFASGRFIRTVVGFSTAASADRGTSRSAGCLRATRACRATARSRANMAAAGGTDANRPHHAHAAIRRAGLPDPYSPAGRTAITADWATAARGSGERRVAVGQPGDLSFQPGHGGVGRTGRWRRA